uniref:DUF3752 domain-containing protein n=1 Tax=Globisporangium ultimum (strain ATCC 200006 / CBS 805.95 / DAOM BR144) TaxID=431595 RepID=K3WPT9_GLOUD
QHRDRDDERRRRDANSSSENADDSDDRQQHAPQHRHRKDEKRSDKKRHAKEKKHKKSSHKKSRRHHDEEPPAPDYKKALVVVKGLLGEFPELLSELITLLQMLDDGEVAVISGIENKRIRSQLKTLFPLLGLTKLSEPKGFAKRGKAQSDTSLLEVFQRMLTGGNVGDEASRVKRDAERIGPSIGPAMPLGGLPGAATSSTYESDDDDDVVGPALPGMKGFRVADERVEAEMARRALELKQAEWDRARGITGDAKDGKDAPKQTRQEWMTVMPESSFFKDSLAPANRGPPGKPAAFRSKEPAAVDHTWFDAPEERDRARRAKLDMELLGYVRDENKPTASSSSSASRLAATGNQQSGGVNESIVPAANPEADEQMRKQMEQLRQERGPSLLEQHQKRLAEEAKASGNKGKAQTGWNRERDLTARRGMSNDDAAKILEASRGINSKFTAPTISRQFL